MFYHVLQPASRSFENTHEHSRVCTISSLFANDPLWAVWMAFDPDSICAFNIYDALLV